MAGRIHERPTLGDAATQIFSGMNGEERDQIISISNTLDAALRERMETTPNPIVALNGQPAKRLQLGEKGRLELIAALGLFLGHRKIPTER